jgi:hypothetical protein
MLKEKVLADHAEGKYLKYFIKSNAVVDAMIVYSNDNFYHTTGPCHACVSNSLKREDGLDSLVITRSDPELVNNEGAVLYYDWLINRSFFSDVFVCKDVKLSLLNGFVKDSKAEAAKWLGAAQLSRLATSEWKSNMLAVYDVLASGFNIHPMLLTFFATQFNWLSSGKVISHNSQKLQNSTNSLFHYSTVHLPFTYFSTVGLIKESCKDDPNKSYRFKKSHSFSTGRWPRESSSCLVPGAISSINDKEVSSLIYKTLTGAPSLLFNLKEKEDTEYTCLWEKAVNVLLAKTQPYSENKAGLNLTALEDFSKQFSLGA